MSTVLITGATGVLGKPLIRLMRERGHVVRVLSRRAEAGTHRGDLCTGEGVAEAAAGVDLVLHAVSDTRRRGHSDLEPTRKLLAVTQPLHLLYVLVAGIDAIRFGCYEAKLGCEREISM